MHISSADYADAFNKDWDAAPHQVAIHLAAPSGTWSTDPQIRDVNINASGNNIFEKAYYRPFQQGIRVTGAWLNVYVHTVWIRDVFNAIYVNQGALIAGPAKFIDVNAYASTPPENGGGSRTWNIFFKSEGHFMEQVEIIHCTYIGSQFIYMSGSTPSPGINPAYNMVIDHNYINNCWIREGEEASRSGIYLDLPPLPDGSKFTRDIRFTNNSCTAKAPRRGAFFYVQGNCRGITFAGNDISCAGDDKCIYIRATQPIGKTEAAIRDIKITNNYLRSFRNPITIGGDLHDPSRTETFYQGEDNDSCWNERIVIAGNQVYSLEEVDQGFVTGCFINRCRSVSVTGNTFADTDGEGLVLRDCKDVSVMGNHFGGFAPDNSKSGIRLIDCQGGSVTGNTIRGVRRGIAVSGSSGVVLGSNVISTVKTGFDLSDSSRLALHGNQVSESEMPARIISTRDAVATGNVLSGTGKVVIEGENVGLVMESNTGTCEPPQTADSPRGGRYHMEESGTEDRTRHDARIAWWREAKFGMFIHWGLYAVPAGEWKGKEYSGIGEWIQFKARIPVDEYAQLAEKFNPVEFDAEAWAQLAQDAGMKYVILTAKHHDGFAMFHSSVSKFNIVDATPFDRDPVLELAQACARRGLKFGVYYSQAQDWHEPGGCVWQGAHEDGPAYTENDWDPKQKGDFGEYLERKSFPQVGELLSNYGPIAVIWFDTPSEQMTDERAERLAGIVHALQPNALVSGRIGGARSSDYDSEGDNQVPDALRPGDWETPATLNDTWGFKKNDLNWKKPEDLVFKLVDIVSKGGNYLLNVGPDARGIIPQASQDILREMGGWLATHGESIYGAGRTPFGTEFTSKDWRCTTKPGILYIHLFTWPGTVLELGDVPATVADAYLLGDSQHTTLPISQNGGDLTVRLPDKPANRIATVLRLNLQQQ